MSDLPINANICEVDGGAYYQVLLLWVPRVGELIDLWSFLDQVDGNTPVHRYEVVQVIHKVHDVAEKVSQSHKGHHFVEILVKPSQSSSFRP